MNILIVCYKIALRKHILIIYIGNPCTRHENIANKKKVKQLVNNKNGKKQECYRENIKKYLPIMIGYWKRIKRCSPNMYYRIKQ